MSQKCQKMLKSSKLFLILTSIFMKIKIKGVPLKFKIPKMNSFTENKF